MNRPDTAEAFEPSPELAAYRRALALTNALIDPAHVLPRSPKELRARAELRMERLRRLLAALGDPHRAYPVIHVAGTSGKGSTAAMIAGILGAGGWRTGLHTSPYLQVATEKIQTDGRLISGSALLTEVERVLAAADRLGLEHITYGEAWFALTASALREAEVDAAVIEVGAGGRFDLTNVVAPAVAVITSVGLDHMETLGGTIEQIAWHKAGIVKPGAPVVSAVDDPAAIPAIRREAAIHGVPIVDVRGGLTIEPAGGGGFAFRRAGDGATFRPAMAGRFQAVNAATAVAAVAAFDPRLAADGRVVQHGLDACRLQGRLEAVQERPTVLLDGAHNPQKAAALGIDLAAMRADRPGARLVLVLGALESKDHAGLLAPLLPLADELVLTTPHVLAKPGAAASSLAATARELGYAGRITERPEPGAAVATALDRCGAGDVVVVTGSLYLVGNVRGRWYPDDEVVVQRTPWPAPRTRPAPEEAQGPEASLAG